MTDRNDDHGGEPLELSDDDGFDPATAEIVEDTEPRELAAELSGDALDESSPTSDGVQAAAEERDGGADVDLLGRFGAVSMDEEGLSLPVDVDGAWAVLSDSARDASGGFAGYQRFWSGIASVSAGDVRVDGDTAHTTLTFVTDDGRTTREGYTFEVGRGDDGKLQIQSANRSSDSA